MDTRTLDLDKIIAGCKRNDTQARKELYELYAPAMLGICVRYTKEKETARDILQDGFIKIYTKINTYSGTGSFEGWMKKVFVTTALEYLRDDKSLHYHTEISNYQESIEDFSVSVVNELSAKEIIDCIQELPDGFRTVFNLYAIEGYSHAEIASMLHIKEASSRSQYARARQLLQIRIKELFSKK
ncbi:sigma-70 family RNA polymerase sigma factor [Bacteroidales bacterium OttesenSCG-928-M11]|nr:sigma-70 family RNA polymerase sigma factor [Bacteroidales bacterium OttesenSCG-928-M11]